MCGVSDMPGTAYKPIGSICFICFQYRCLDITAIVLSSAIVTCVCRLSAARLSPLRPVFWRRRCYITAIVLSSAIVACVCHPSAARLSPLRPVFWRRRCHVTAIVLSSAIVTCVCRLSAARLSPLQCGCCPICRLSRDCLSADRVLGLLLSVEDERDIPGCGAQVSGLQRVLPAGKCICGWLPALSTIGIQKTQWGVY